MIAPAKRILGHEGRWQAARERDLNRMPALPCLFVNVTSGTDPLQAD